MKNSPPSDFWQLRPEVRLAAWLALGLAGVVILDQLHYWQTREDFSFGYLVPVFVGYVLYERWPQLKAIWLGESPMADAAGGGEKSAGGLQTTLQGIAIVVTLGSLLLFLFGGFLRAVTGPDNDSALALGLGIGGYVLAMGFLISGLDAAGRAIPLARRGRVVALLVFPALAWLISAPVLLIFESRIKLVLLEYVVTIVSHVFDLLGFAVYRDGSTLVLPKGRVGVAEACSGIRSLTACLFAGSFLAAVFVDRFWKKVLMLSMAAVLAFVMNIGRSLFLTGWAYANGSDALDADFWGNPHHLKDAAGQFVDNPAFRYISVHDFTGYTVLGFTLVGLLLLLPLMNYKINLEEEPETGGTPPATGENGPAPAGSAPPPEVKA